MPSTATDRHPIRIWLVDDNAEFRHLLAMYLGGEDGFECSRQFSSAEDTLDALSQEASPDVILLDVNLGGLNGIDAIRPIKSLAGSTRVIILTTFTNGYDQQLARRYGASDFLIKSCSLPEIPHRIRQAVE